MSSMAPRSPASSQPEASPTEGAELPVDDAEIEELARRRRVARSLHQAARRALGLARRYRDEEGAGGERERACVTQALAWRSESKAIAPELGRGRAASTLPERPGLARARAKVVPSTAKTNAG